MFKSGLFLTTVSAIAVAFCVTTAAPQQALAYESVVAPPETGPSNRSPAQQTEGTYGGVVSPPPRSNNPYQSKPADNLYDFVENGGDQTPGSLEEARRKAVEMRKERARAAQQQNAERVQKQRAEWAKMRADMQKKQQDILQQARESGALPYER